MIRVQDRRGRIEERVVHVSLDVAADCVANLHPEARAPDVPNSVVRRSVEHDPGGPRHGETLVIRYEVREYAVEGAEVKIGSGVEGQIVRVSRDA